MYPVVRMVKTALSATAVQIVHSSHQGSQDRCARCPATRTGQECMTRIAVAPDAIFTMAYEPAASLLYDPGSVRKLVASDEPQGQRLTESLAVETLP